MANSFSSSLTVRRSDQRWRHRGFCCKGWSRKMLASSLLCLWHVWGATGRSHLLLPGWQDLLWPSPRRETKTPLLCLRWGAYLGLQTFEWEIAQMIHSSETKMWLRQVLKEKLLEESLGMFTYLTPFQFHLSLFSPSESIAKFCWFSLCPFWSCRSFLRTNAPRLRADTGTWSTSVAMNVRPPSVDSATSWRMEDHTAATALSHYMQSTAMPVENT